MRACHKGTIGGGGDGVSYIAFQTCHIIGWDAPPDGLDSHFSPVVSSLPNTREKTLGRSVGAYICTRT